MELVISRPAPKDDRFTATRVEVFGDATGLGADGQTYRLVAPPGVDPTTGALSKPNTVLSKRADNRGCMWLWSGFAQRTHPSNALRCEGKYVPPQVGHESGGSTTGAQGGINKLGTYYCWNRTYDVFMGRWTTPDPAASPWGNLWDYVRTRPTQRSDPSGLGEDQRGLAFDRDLKSLAGKGPEKISATFNEYLSTVWSAWLEFEGGDWLGPWMYFREPDCKDKCFRCRWLQGPRMRMNIVKEDRFRETTFTGLASVQKKSDAAGEAKALTEIAVSAAGVIVSTGGAAIVSVAGLGLSIANKALRAESGDYAVTWNGAVSVTFGEYFGNWYHFEREWVKTPMARICEDVECEDGVRYSELGNSATIAKRVNSNGSWSDHGNDAGSGDFGNKWKHVGSGTTAKDPTGKPVSSLPEPPAGTRAGTRVGVPKPTGQFPPRGAPAPGTPFPFGNPFLNDESKYGR